jgi:chromosome segregation ATPase
MKIPNEILSEKNYEGTRLIEITDTKVAELKAKLNALQAEANPTLEKMEAITPAMDLIFKKIGVLEEQKKTLHAELEPIRAPYDELLKEVEKIDQRAQLIKNKIQPLVNSIVAPMLGEFEKANQMIEKDGKLFVEVVDELEEKVKAIRAAKAKK